MAERLLVDSDSTRSPSCSRLAILTGTSPRSMGTGTPSLDTSTLCCTTSVLKGTAGTSNVRPLKSRYSLNSSSARWESSPLWSATSRRSDCRSLRMPSPAMASRNSPRRKDADTASTKAASCKSGWRALASANIGLTPLKPRPCLSLASRSA